MEILMLAVLAVWILRFNRARRLERLNPFTGREAERDCSKRPPVSIILAARDEERNIARCLHSLCLQDYPDFEIVVADDRSSDKTGEIVTMNFPGIKYLRIDSLPEKFSGKSHAVYEASKRATGEWLLFTDADTVHLKNALRETMNYSLQNKIDMLSLIPQPILAGFWEKALQPMMGLLIFLLFDPEKINRPAGRASFAVGQYILISRSAYGKIGGHEKLLYHPLEDIAIAQNAKKHGLKYSLLFGGNIFKSRMYDSLSGLYTGWERIFFLIYNEQIWQLPIIASAIFILSLLPYIMLHSYPLLCTAQLILMHLSLERGFDFIRADKRYIFANPLGSVFMLMVLLSAFWKKVTKKGVVWRGKRYHRWCSTGSEGW
jgi:chlorobactene glucosyltransferase